MIKTIKKDKVIIATVHPWNIVNAKKLQAKHRGVVLVTNPKKLTLSFLRLHNPRYIFFPHWSWYIPAEILWNYECVVFHMTDLPYGRGGSPLQNLILRGHKMTKISAIKAVEEMDAGPVYLKMPLSLYGTAEDIFKRASDIIFSRMIPEILRRDITPKPQKGRAVIFTRRKPEDGDLCGLDDPKKIFDQIRMLDAPGYPKAFLRSGGVTVRFSNARYRREKIIAEVEVEWKK